MPARYARRWRTLTAAFAAILLGIPVSHAASVTWGSPTDISGDPADVSLNGSLVGGFNFGGSDTTVNGVTFKGFAIGTTPPDVTSMTVDFAMLSIVQERAGHTLADFDTSSSLAPFSLLIPNYAALLGTSAGSSFADRTTTLTLSGLMIGTTYEFEAWVNDSGISGCCSFGIFLDSGNSVDLDPNTAKDPMSDRVLEGGLGQFVVGTFVADATTQAFDFGRGEISGGLNGVQLRELAPAALTVPEPTTFALLGAGLLGLASRRRRATPAT